MSVISSQPLKSIGQSSSSNKSFPYPPTTGKYEELVQSPDLFWALLKPFNEAIGVKLKPPVVGGRPVDLFRLFVEVTSRGGVQKTIEDRSWKEVISTFNYSSSVTSGSFVVRKLYLEQLYDFEQAYYLGKKARPVSALDSVNGSASAGAPEQGNSSSQDGSSVNGVIDGKFDGGYLVTVNVGSQIVRGVLYHSNPTHGAVEGSVAMIPTAVAPKRRRKRSRKVLKDPSRPKSNRSGYNFFFAEHYIRLKPDYQGREKEIGRAIGQLWNNLSYDEKQVYQERGTQDKERYRAELEEYRATLQSAAQ